MASAGRPLSVEALFVKCYEADRKATAGGPKAAPRAARLAQQLDAAILRERGTQA